MWHQRRHCSAYRCMFSVVSSKDIAICTIRSIVLKQLSVSWHLRWLFLHMYSELYQEYSTTRGCDLFKSVSQNPRRRVPWKYWQLSWSIYIVRRLPWCTTTSHGTAHGTTKVAQLKSREMKSCALRQPPARKELKHVNIRSLFPQAYIMSCLF
jgi:hypothetical protein